MNSVRGPKNKLGSLLIDVQLFTGGKKKGGNYYLHIFISYPECMIVFLHRLTKDGSQHIKDQGVGGIVHILSLENI